MDNQIKEKLKESEEIAKQIRKFKRNGGKIKKIKYGIRTNDAAKKEKFNPNRTIK